VLGQCRDQGTDGREALPVRPDGGDGVGVVDHQDMEHIHPLQPPLQVFGLSVGLLSGLTPANGTPAAMARAITAWVCRGLDANSTWSGTPAGRQRSRSSIQEAGKYSSRSINARPCQEAYAKNVPI
jgi:hypothetical protein